jgi:alkanesulfonate monooxygenase SsuD/methylene tetrahydromethanopterin reductase-like flavin-dependent oxidoreductase (luciferase family)
VARYGDGWCPGGLSPEKARECIPQIKKMAKEEYGRDPEKLEFGVLLMGGAAPTADTLKQYREAGITRVVVAAAGSANGDGIKAIQELEGVVSTAARL